MPLFEYKCEECLQTVEVLEAADTKVKTACGKCGLFMTRQFPLSSFKITRIDLDWAGTPQYADARAKQCGVPT